MELNPIIPIWLMAIICVIMLCMKRKGVVAYIRQIVIVLLLFTINLRIMVPDPEHVVETPSIDAYVLFAVDSTISMLADDMGEDSTRLDEAKKDLKHIVGELEGAKFAVVDFNNTGKLVSPFTDDVNRVKTAIDIISPIGTNYAQGSSFNNCQSLIIDQLQIADSKEDANVYIFFVSDGEANTDDDLESFDKISEYVDGGAVMGYGTSKGGTMTAKGFSGDVVVTDRSGKPAISRLNEDNLISFAEQMDISYVHMKNSSNIDEIIQDVLDNVAETQEEKTIVAYKETYYYLLLPVAVLLVWDFIHFKRKV